MFTKNLVAALLVVSALSVAGCGDVTAEDQEAAELRLPGFCGLHVGRYVGAIGARLDGGTGCQFAPATTDAVLPPEHAGTACETTLSHYAANPPSARNIFLGHSEVCQWSANGDVGSCVMVQKAIVGGVACTSEVALSYKRVQAVVW